MTYSIYALTDPASLAVRYVGITRRKLRVRLYRHLSLEAAMATVKIRGQDVEDRSNVVGDAEYRCGDCGRVSFGSELPV